jgi:hypothetical protein
LFLTPETTTSAAPFVRPLGIAIPALALLALAVLGMTGVALLNWPKFLVAPHHRDQPGAITEWIQSLRRRRARRN